MLSPEQINEIHRLSLIEKWPHRRIARHLHMGRHTVLKYLDNPAPTPSRRDRPSKLDAFKPALAEWLQQDPEAPATVLLHRLQTLGYEGGITILKDYLQAQRRDAVRRRAYVRMEPGPGECSSRRQSGPVQSPLPRFRPRVRIHSARLSRGGGLGKRQGRARHRICPPNLLAVAFVR